MGILSYKKGIISRLLSRFIAVEEKEKVSVWERRFKQIAMITGEWIWEVDEKGYYTYCNSVVEQVLGYKADELLGKHLYDLSHPEDREGLKTLFDLMEKRDAFKEFEYRNIHKNGHTVILEVSGVPILSHDGMLLGYVGTSRDITERKQAEERIKYLSLHDSLTGLYNRAYFEEEMKRLNTTRKYPVGIIMVDIDNLKFVNDVFGHFKGDELLKHLANILTSIFRKEDVVARIGGDEFAIILPNVDEGTTQSFCKRITNACKDSNPGLLINLTVSIGYAIQYGQYRDMQEALKVADKHMYKDKLVGNTSAQRHVIDSLTIMLAERDPHTEKHSEELQELAYSLGKEIGLPEHKLKDLRLLALLHDIGKVGIPDSILYKADKLSPKEWEIMKRHCEIGYRIARNIPELAPIAEGVLCHHEWWNGEGYPKGLKGEQIPILARIVSIVDAYNVIQSDRPYKRARSKQEAIKEIKKGAGTQFDPELVKKFLKMVEEK